MRIVEINMIHSGSTGKIMFGIAEVARQKGHEVWTFSPRYYQKGQEPMWADIKGHTYFGTVSENKLHLRLSQMTGFHGCFSWFGTKELIRKLDEIQPDIIHLHNLHNWCINLPMLFSYIKKHDIAVVWTLHDCWSFTGKCPYFTVAQCDRWKTGCFACPQVRQYPQSYVDQTRLMWKLKKRWFTGVKNLTIVTPSQWLAGVVKQSYLKEYPIKVINNGIDLNVFHPTGENQGGGKYTVLFVSFGWSVYKGLDVIQTLADSMKKQYQIIVVGTNEVVDRSLPEKIVKIHRTQDQQELAAIYSAADVLVNPTREEVLGMVNIEALACGTPVVTFDTGGSPECIDNSCGIVVPKNDVSAMKKAIEVVCTEKPYSVKACVRRAEKFTQEEKYDEYVELYKTIKEE